MWLTVIVTTCNLSADSTGFCSKTKACKHQIARTCKNYYELVEIIMLRSIVKQKNKQTKKRPEACSETKR